MMKINLKLSNAAIKTALVIVVAALALAAFAAPLSSVTSAQESASKTKPASDSAHSGAASTKSVETTTVVAASPRAGEAAPEFHLPYATQEKIFFDAKEQMTLASQRGKNVILAFYPADWSGGCTKEVCTLRDTFAELSKLNATVLGISGDYVFSHQEWAKHHNLQFPLVSDHKHEVARMYGVYDEASGFNNRSVFLIDKAGVVRYMNLKFKAGEKKDYDDLRAALEKLN